MATVRLLASPLSFVRTVVPTVCLVGMAPQTFIIWIGWRAVSLIMPVWLYQRVDDIIFGLYQRIILFFYEHVLGTEVLLYGDAKTVLKVKERVLYISNHQSDVDWIIVHMLAARQGMLGQVRYVLKDTIQLVPLYGHYLYQHGCIYVKRSQFNPWKMTRALKYLQNPKIRTWMVVFPEGTRFNPESKALVSKSRKYAVEQGMEPLNHVLTPRVRGVSLVLNELRNHFDAIYNVTTIYEGTRDPVNGQQLRAPTMFEFLRIRKPKLHIHLERVGIESVPTIETELQEWLHRCFVEKDRLMKSYYMCKSNGNANVMSAENFVFGERTVSQLSRWTTFPAFFLYTAILVPFIMFSVGRQLYWKILIFGSVGGYTWLAIRSVA